MACHARNLYRSACFNRFKPDLPGSNALWYEALYMGTPRWLSNEQWNAMDDLYDQARQSGKAVDHILPLRGVSEDGFYNICGLNVPWNFALLHKHENSSKGNRFYLADRQTEEARLLERHLVEQTTDVFEYPGARAGDVVYFHGTDLVIGRGVGDNQVVSASADELTKVWRFVLDKVLNLPPDYSMTWFGLPRYYKFTIPFPLDPALDGVVCHSCGDARKLYGKKKEPKLCTPCLRLNAETINSKRMGRFFNWIPAEWDYQHEKHAEYERQVQEAQHAKYAAQRKKSGLSEIQQGALAILAQREKQNASTVNAGANTLPQGTYHV